VNKLAYRPPPVFVSDHAAGMIICLWYAKKNTNEIAKALSLPEYEVANRLLLLRERHKQMRLSK
jgi:hypothetical protein